MRVAILPTGRTEWEGLGHALGRLFPEHEFYSLPSVAEIESNPAGFPYPGFTSVELTAVHEKTPPESAQELVSRAAQEALGDRRKKAADLVIIVDDVELLNIGQPARVVAVMRSAVKRHLSELQVGHRRRTIEVLKEKVSFHLIAPMIEAWFFADKNALKTAGVPDDAAVCFADNIDPETFVTDDAAYLAATETDCPTLAKLASHRKKKLRPKWLGALPRGRHPKGYLQWLCRAPNERNCTRYSESEGGGAALKDISWPSLFGRPDIQFSLLRAFIADLEDRLGPPCIPVRGIRFSLTARSNAPRAALLRNL